MGRGILPADSFDNMVIVDSNVLVYRNNKLKSRHFILTIFKIISLFSRQIYSSITSWSRIHAFLNHFFETYLLVFVLGG